MYKEKQPYIEYDMQTGKLLRYSKFVVVNKSGNFTQMKDKISDLVKMNDTERIEEWFFCRTSTGDEPYKKVNYDIG